MAQDKQPQLIPKKDLPPESGRISADTSILAAMGAFEEHMQEKGFSVHTVKAFISDLRLLAKFVGIGQPIGNIGTKDLNDFLHWLVHDRGVPCSPKSYARRVTTLKVFFGWLRKGDMLIIDPAEQVVQRTVTSPLPTIPSNDELARAYDVTERWRTQGHKGKLDARPHLLLQLLLKTGLKKSEAMGVVPNHIERDEDEPYVFIRYKSPRLRYKERKLVIDHDWLAVLDEYLAQYKPQDTLFTCTARNLEYILRDVGEEAGLDKGLLSFENLRWASALNDYMAGEDQDHIRQRLGLSKVTWRDTKNKLSRLAEKMAPPA